MGNICRKSIETSTPLVSVPLSIPLVSSIPNTAISEEDRIFRLGDIRDSTLMKRRQRKK